MAPQVGRRGRVALGLDVSAFVVGPKLQLLPFPATLESVESYLDRGP